MRAAYDVSHMRTQPTHRSPLLLQCSRLGLDIADQQVQHPAQLAQHTFLLLRVGCPSLPLPPVYKYGMTMVFRHPL